MQHNLDMNYSSSQALIIGTDSKGRVVDWTDTNSTFRIEFLISSRAALYFNRTFARDQSGAWRETHIKVSPELFKLVADELGARGLTECDGAVRQTMATGHVTKLDAVPATVFQVLFTEL